MVSGGSTLDSALRLRPRYHEYNRNLLPVELLPPESISNTLLWLFSDESRHVTGVALPVGAGWTTF